MAHYNINDDVDHVLITEAELDETVTRIAREIDRDQENREGPFVLLGILKGSVVFMSDLMKKLSTPLEIEFMRVSSYGAGTSSSGAIKIGLDINRSDLDKADILIVEDIIDSGRTLSLLNGYLAQKGARRIRTCTLLDKPSRREVDFTPDYVGKIIPNDFVVGYGLDYAEKYRDLPYVGVLKPEIYLN